MMKSLFLGFWKRSENPLSIHIETLHFLKAKLDNFARFRAKGPMLHPGVKLAQHARELASEQKVNFKRRTSFRFAAYLRKTYKNLNDAYLILIKSLRDQKTSASGSEWIVDNFYLLEELVQSCNGFFASLRKRNLPILRSGKFAGMPRIYELARELFDHTDSLVTKEDIDIFINAYQEITILTLEELEGFPHFLHLALLENLYVFAQINVILYKQQLSALKFHKNISNQSIARKLDRKLGKQTIGTIVLLLQSLKESGPVASEPFQLITNKCNCEDMVTQVLHIKSAYQISISNIFATLRNLNNLHWNNWLERHSYVHALLQTDPTGIYGISEFETRAQCRYAIKRLSAANSSKEAETAQLALEFAMRKGLEKKDSALKFKSIVYYLIGDGILLFESSIRYKSPYKLKISRSIKSNIITISFISLLASISIALTVPLLYEYWVGSGFWTMAFLVTLFLILASEVAIQGLQWLAAHFASPEMLPTLDYQKGIPDDQRTLVCVHIQLSNRNHLRKSVKNLKIAARTNPQRNIFFALVVDCQPAKLKETPDEQDLICYAAQLVKRLNKREVENIRFFLLFRHRSFSRCEGQFLGWERKRGKLHQLNSLILGEATEQMIVECGDVNTLRTIRYVLTLDEDTMIPPGGAVKLIQTIAHPLNEAVFDPATNVVVEGYGIIQPKITTSLKSASRSRFAKLFAHLPGLEAYDYTVSNTYQDLFAEGSYIGKAIYDVRTFELALKNRFPDEHVLSHDLLEGLFARVGLVSNLELLDEFPKNYMTFYRRLHRWIRGDWQLLPWLARLVPTLRGNKIATPISALGRFKIFDNLRRSLVEPAAFFAFLASFTVLPGSPLFWIALVFFGINFSLLISIAERVTLFIFRREDKRHYASEEKLSTIIMRALVHLSFLAMQAYVALHAILITIYRLFISRKHLLEWTTASDVERKTGSNFSSFVKDMLPGVILGILSTFLVALFFPQRLVYAAPILIGWILSPLVAFILAKPVRERRFQFDDSEYKKLLEIAYDTFLYFNEFATVETNFLAPDNVQMVPTPKVAMRTSPTNIGFHLQSIISAYDLGALFLPKVLCQISQIFQTMSKMERFRGHFLNWYDINSLQPLYPRFVSTVDSGNLIGHLITLKSSLKNMRSAPIVQKHHWHHIQASVKQLEEHTSVPAPRIYEPQTFAQLKEQLDLLAYMLHSLKKGEQSPDQSQIFSQHKVQRGLKFLDEVLQLREFLQGFLAIENQNKLGALYAHLMSLPPTWISLQSACEQILSLLHKDHEKSESDAKFMALNLQCKAMRNQIQHLIKQSSQMINEINFDFLYSEEEELLSIGYHVDTDKLDANYYNLLASEVSLTSLIAVAKNEVPSKHWFALGRALVDSSGGKTLLSWSGSVFEYLMPTIFYNLIPNTLLDKSFMNCVKAQENHALHQRLPWGESESAYAAIDINGNFLYRAFGVPELGLKRDLADNHVVSPYSTFLALHFDTAGALKNIKTLEKEGARGEYGFYDAIDYTQSRLETGKKSYIIRSFFAHHQGMIICALNNILNSEILRKRFHQSSLIHSAELLLQERFPTFAQTISLPKHLPLPVEKKSVERSRSIKTAFTRFPNTHLLSNGSLSTMIDNAGSGFMFFGPNLALTNWNEDAIADNCGYYIFVRDLDTNDFWSLGFQPSRITPDRYAVIFHPERAIFQRANFDIELHAEITISPEHDAEVRKMIVTNYSNIERNLEITSYAEVVLDPLPAFLAHPSFSKMFISSEYRNDLNALIFNRRHREKDEPDLFLMHTLVCEKDLKVDQWESSRAHFLGSGNSIFKPAALLPGANLSNTTGFTLDPIFSLRTRFKLKAGRAIHFSFVTGVTKTRDDCEALLRHYAAPNSVERAFQMSYAHSEIGSLYEHLPLNDLHAFQEFTKALFFFLPKSEEGQKATRINKLRQSDIWRFGISGDLPIVFFRYSDRTQIAVLKKLLAAFNYLRSKQLHFDLFILNEYVEGYRRDIQDELEQHVVLAMSGHSQQQKTGKITLQNITQCSKAEITLLSAIAHRIITVNEKDPFLTQDFLLTKQHALSSAWKNSNDLNHTENLEFFNGYGGFFDDAKAYRIVLSKQILPRPWSNVIGTKHVGFMITEKGGGYTWSDNSQANCLTSRSGDPIQDPCSELIYIRNRLDNSLFSPLPFPRREGKHVIEHHFGFSLFKAQSDQLSSQLSVTCSQTERIKWFCLKLTNNSELVLNLDLFFYVDWVLGNLREKSAPHIFCSYDNESELLYAQNTYRDIFDERVSFIGASEKIANFTSSRAEFVGRHRDLNSPLLDVKNTLSSGTDICGALQIVLDLKPKETKEVVLFLGEAESLQDLKKHAESGRSIRQYEDSLQKIKSEWSSLTSTIQVKTPDRGFDLLMNGWLLYQTVSCRLLARASFYQPSGAFGFRDQLQDVLSLLAINPKMARDQILLSASRQFEEGDVQHWWMPISGKGVRTRYSDDLLWLPYVLCRYIETTNDTSILEEQVHFISGPMLTENEKSAYFEPKRSEKSTTIYNHCIQAIDRSLAVGVHGIPLMLGGDWNDGMNRVGSAGKGESVWLGWFLCDILLRFSELAKSCGDEENAQRYLSHRNKLLQSLEEHAWDGAWYRRAFFDDGTPLGSVANEECQIDSIAQSWSVIAKGNNLERQKQAMDSVFSYLVDTKNHLIKLLTPPFDKIAHDPGYIKAYPPGIRENGGQYTHASTWVILASALLGQGKRACDLFRLINPIYLTKDEEGVRRYQAEPYVIAGDVYSVEPHKGEAGWSWYTGSSGWLFSVGLEEILGLKRRGNVFSIDPCVAPDWKEFFITYKVKGVTYAISVNNPDGVEKGVRTIKVDGMVIENKLINLAAKTDVEKIIDVEVLMG